LADGDSKTAGQGGWIAALRPQCWGVQSVGVGGSTVATALAAADTRLGSVTVTPDTILLGWGVNDASAALPNEATWKANWALLLAEYTDRWPAAAIYIAKPWSGAYGDDARWDTLAGWIDDVVAACGASCHAGADERDSGFDQGMEWTDNGVTYYADDLIHYDSTVGQARWALLWKWVLGL